MPWRFIEGFKEKGVISEKVRQHFVSFSICRFRTCWVRIWLPCKIFRNLKRSFFLTKGRGVFKDWPLIDFLRSSDLKCSDQTFVRSVMTKPLPSSRRIVCIHCFLSKGALGKLKKETFSPDNDVEPFWLQLGTQQNEGIAKWIHNNTESKGCVVKTLHQGLTSLASTLLVPGRPSDPPYLHLAYDHKIILNQTKPVFMLTLIKSFSCQSFRQNYFWCEIQWVVLIETAS